ncbi:EAL domain, c-di-GMP-specific phosphodiesterase class I (or its enzymatically inactive variant) [Amphibacillus marinus]|uniref:EAL domain, c-di-GMP-specific phosphodiesterase class I (Or its enzymatically inactive variant) n=1 Tax=Amphibacillus marinus TaxID=872970 RepID=A0A1H8IHM9_9BACI|nr:EAL domain-containing protein [Amphibacillus marinus]SEN68390.1 EAL domain, c-di-GMP-specific phosphodiesterase class I (or its enzymatically inactive variant) [Amphibacillus marinus]
MSELDFSEDINEIRPAFQPIISGVTHEVVGYELFAQRNEAGDLRNLTEVLMHEDISAELKLEIKQQVLQQALRTVAKDKNLFLSIKRSAQELLIDDGQPLLDTLNHFGETGFPTNRIILEVNEEDIEYYFAELYHLLLYYKNCGIQLAIGQLGNKTATMDRIRQLEPNVLKINTKIIGNDDTKGYDDIMYSFEMLADRIGASLLFCNIEDDFLQYFAWKHGGRYYQGAYLGTAQPDISPMKMIGMAKITNQFVNRQKHLIEERMSWIIAWEKTLNELANQWKNLAGVEDFLVLLGEAFNEASFRIYICNSDGLQVSPNYYKADGQWLFEDLHKGSNWAFRPYFLENMMQMRTWNRAMLSKLYADIETRERIRTLSCSLNGDFFIFIDISYSFLYENESLLI